MNNKKNLVFMIIGAITLIAVTLGATYAYFTAQSGGSGNIDTDVITGTTDNLSFSFGDLINIYATEENFGQGMGSISDSTTGRAILRANNTTNEATATYNIYLIIEANDFVYSTEDAKPEILLNVTDPNGNKVENITGLIHYEDGFDITTRTGGFLLVPDYEISATNVETIQDWNIEITLVNLDSDQNANTNKTLTGRLYLTQEQMSSYELAQIKNVESSTTYNTINVTPEITSGSAEVKTYFFGIEETTDSAVAYNSENKLTKLSNTLASIDDISFIESDTPDYKFSNLEPNTEYTIYSYVEDENKIKSNVYSTNITTDEYELPIIDSVSHSVTLNSITLTVNATNGSNEIVKYMYSKDNGASWEESTNNTHTFNGLTDTTQYKIKVKVVDSEGAESTEYYEAITTEVYILPVVASVNATTTWNSITLTPSGTNGTNAIDHYEYSINSGAYQTSNVFSNLTDNTNYTIRVKAIDTAGRESNVYETTVRTDAYVLPTISVSTSSTANSITINVSATTGDGSIVSYHYSRDNGSNYQTSNSNNYTFTGLTVNTTYYLRVYVTDSNGRTSAVTNISVKTQGVLFAEYIKNLYTSDGVNNIYLHNGSGTYGSLEASDGSYRYSGANPNNYVCFGSDASSCPSNNLYRIVGVFGNQVKLIKYNALGSYYWSGSASNSSNNWQSSTLNSSVLNGTYLSGLGTWADKIATSTWQIGGMDDAYGYSTPKTIYNYEVGNYKRNVTYNAKIGLMYVSDYVYAASPNYWSYRGYDTSGSRQDYRLASDYNWLYYDDFALTISLNYPTSDCVYIIYSQGHVNNGPVNNEYSVGLALPTFYLNSDVIYTSGTGTVNNPYRIA